VGALEFDYQAYWGLDVSAMRWEDNFLPGRREAIFPSVMPVGFAFVPGIAVVGRDVGEVPDVDLAALRDEGGVTGWAGGFRVWGGLDGRVFCCAPDHGLRE
jgi:hypothetical protein